MGQDKRRSIVADRSSQNFGDDPLSAPETPCPPIDEKKEVKEHQLEGITAEAARPPWEVAKYLILSPAESQVDPWTINGDLDGHDLAATYNLVGSLMHAQPASPDSSKARSAREGNVQQTHDSRQPQGEAGGPEAGSASTGKPQQAVTEGGAAIKRFVLSCATLSLLTIVGSLLIQFERLGIIDSHIFPRIGFFAVLLSGLPGASLALMCYVKMPKISASTQQLAACSTSLLSDPALAFLSTTLTAKGIEAVRYSQQLQVKFSLNVLRALCAFVFWDMLQTYAILGPLQHIFLEPFSASQEEPPLFGPSPLGAKIGIAGYPPRRAMEQEGFFSVTWLPQLVLPLLADGVRLFGLCFAFVAFRKKTCEEMAQHRARDRRCRLVGGSQTVLLGLVALLVASLALQQVFGNSECIPSFRGLLPLEGERVVALAGALARSHAVALAMASALTGAILAAAFESLLVKNSQSTSKILGLLASISLFCSIAFDVLASASPSADLKCAFISFPVEIHTGRLALKAFAAAAAVAHLFALLCLSCSATFFGITDVLLAAASRHQQIDEAHSLSIKTR